MLIKNVMNISNPPCAALTSYFYAPTCSYAPYRALSAAQDVAKRAVQTVERTQYGGGSAPGALARRLRAVCAAMEVRR